MATRVRIATLNLENLDDGPRAAPPLADRIAVMRPQLLRLDADILCLQEVNGQEQPGQPRDLLALNQLLQGTPYAGFHRASTMTADEKQVYDLRNLVVLSRYPIVERRQHLQDFVAAPRYQLLTAQPPSQEARPVEWERPILYVKIQLPTGSMLHVLNLHLKSKLPTKIPGGLLDKYTWRSSSAWAEGSFLSALKRVGQALEARILVDRIFDEDAHALIVICGDFNADVDEVPMEAIRGDVENTGNSRLAGRVLIPCERSVAESARFSLYHHGKGCMLDHLMASRSLLAHYHGTEIHNELLHDESVAFAGDVKFPESDHAPVVAEFGLPD